jgi:hypothetical protein
MTTDEAQRVLGLQRDATRRQIKSAYRTAAVWCHPDQNPGNPTAEETFKRVSEAYRVLLSSPRPPPSVSSPPPRAWVPIAEIPARFWTARKLALVALIALVPLAAWRLAPLLHRRAPDAYPIVRVPNGMLLKTIEGSIAVLYSKPCALKATQQGPLQRCLALEITNGTRQRIDTAVFSVYLREKKSGERRPLRPTPFVEEHLWEVDGLRLAPGRSTTTLVRGVTDEAVAEAAVEIDDLDVR